MGNFTTYNTLKISPGIDSNKGIRKIIIAWIVLFVLYLFQIFLITNINRYNHFVGDEYHYFNKAKYLVENGHFPKVYAEGQNNPNDFRPPGYPLIVASLLYFSDNPNTIKYNIFLLNTIGILFLITLLFYFSQKMVKNSATLIIFAFILGVQPWLFEFVRLILTDSLTTVITAIALFSLTFFIIEKKNKYIYLFLVMGETFLCMTFFMRPEMIVYPPVFTLIVILLKTRTAINILKYGLISGVIFLIFIGANVSYRVHIGDQPLGFIKNTMNVPGLRKWVKTWINTEKESTGTLRAIKHRRYNDVDLPQRAFADDLEKERIFKALHLLKKNGRYTKEVDSIFEDVAEKRINENYFLNKILPRIWYCIHLWINLETNSQLLYYLKDFSENVRDLILGFFLLLKISIIIFGFSSIFILYFRFRSGSFFWYDYLTLIMLLNISVRTVLIGFIIGMPPEHRYSIIAWFSMLWTGIYSIHMLVLPLQIQYNINKLVKA